MALDIDTLEKVPFYREVRGFRGAYYLNSVGDCSAKTCSDCKDVLPSSDFPKGSGKYGLNNRCTQCVRQDCRDQYYRQVPGSDTTLGVARSRTKVSKNLQRTNQEALADILDKRPDGTKKCGSCRITMPITLFGRHMRRGDSLADDCLECSRISSYEWRTKAHLEYWADIGVPLECYVCGETDNLHADHVIPKSKGGSDYLDNRLPLCAYHNVSKNDTGLRDWLSTKHPEKLQEVINRVECVYNVKISTP